MKFKLVGSLALLAVSVFAAKQERPWKTGKVLDSQSAKRVEQFGSSTTANGSATTTGSLGVEHTTGTATANTVIHHVTIQETQLMIAGDEYAYIVEDTVQHGRGLYSAMANRKHGCRLVVGDPVKYEQEKNALWVLDADGKECKMEIIRQERIKSATEK